MDLEKIKHKVIYRDKLNKEAKEQLTGSIRTNTEWSTDLNKLPQTTFPDVFSYLVCGVSAYNLNQTHLSVNNNTAS